MTETTRRKFFQFAGMGVASASIVGGVDSCAKSEQSATEKPVNEMRKTEQITHTDGYKRLNLGMASYTLRKINLEETLAMTKRLGLDRIAFKSFHLPLDSTEKQIRSVAELVKAARLDLYGCGVVYMNDESEVHRAFDYAKTAGMKIIIGVPEHNLLDLVNRKVQEYDIKLAIHNHGPGDERYPSPESAYEKVKDLDPRMGLCIDIGHAKRIGIDPSEAAEMFSDRLHDVHIKDVSAASKQGTTVEIGRGVIDIPKFLRTLLKINYTGTVALEFEKDPDDPLPGSAESIGYLKGVLSVI